MTALAGKKNQKCGDKYTLPLGQSLKVDCTGQQGRFVAIVVPGSNKALVLCEVKVTASDYFGSNAAVGKPARQSSTEGSASAARAVDGKATNIFSQKSCTRTKMENEPWWSVDLEQPSVVTEVQVFNRGDCCGERLSKAEVRVGDSGSDWSKNTMCGARFSVPQGGSKRIACPTVKGRYVFVVIRERQILTLCEVRVVTIDPKKGINIARGKPAKQSSTTQGGVASRAVDGNIDTIYSKGSCTHTHYDTEPWWRVDLESAREIGGVQIWNRGDCCGSRLSNFEVRVGMSEDWKADKQCGLRHSVPQGRRKTIACNGITGRYVYIVKRGKSYLNICEVRVLPNEGFKGEGCQSQALGMESRAITNEMLRASSTADDVQGKAENARLNFRGVTWTATYKKPGEWLEIALKEKTTVTAVAIQGSATSAEWVTAYKVKYYDGQQWKWYDDGKILDGATNQNKAEKVKLEKPFQALKVRLYPTSWQGAISMRVELYGHTCKKEQTEEVDERKESEPRCKHADEIMKCVPERPTFLKINSFPGYGDGEARLWYAHDKGSGASQIMGNSIYVDKDVDFRTQRGSIFASKDLIAGRYVRIGAWPGYGTGAAQLRFSEKSTDSSDEDEIKANSLFIDNANFHVKDGSISSDLNIQAGKYLELKAFPGFGDGIAQFWYSAVSSEKYSAKTVYLKSGNLKAEEGSVIATKDIVASEHLEISAFPKFGQGKATLWYAHDSKGSIKSNSLYLKDGDFRAQAGSIFANQDLHAGHHLVLESQEEYGLGAAKLWYAKSSKDGLGPNTLYLDESDLSVHHGSISADKDISAGRFVQIGAYPGYGSGAAKLWYSQVGKGELKGDSLYLTGGDFRTETGSIYSAQDVHANRYLGVHALEGHGSGKAELWYSETQRGHYAANSLYLKKGNFRTESGSVVAGKDLEATRYISINAFPGFGSGKASLWYSNDAQDGYHYNSLYLKSGDFRTEKGSVVSSKDIVATEKLKLSAAPGFGQGAAELWYSQSGRGDYRSETLYLTHGDFRTQHGSIFAGKNLHVGRYLEISAWPGHGSGSAQLWHGKTEQGTTSALYLKEGDFLTQEGSVISNKDLHAGRYVSIGAKEGFGEGSAKLWYSRTGKGAITPNTLHLESGDFKAQTGSISAAVDIIAGDKLKAEKLQVEFASVSGSLAAGHLFLGSSQMQENSLLQDATEELLDVSNGPSSQHLDVGQALTDLDEHLRTLSDTNKKLKSNLDMLLGKVSRLERNL